MGTTALADNFISASLDKSGKNFMNIGSSVSRKNSAAKSQHILEVQN